VTRQLTHQKRNVERAQPTPGETLAQRLRTSLASRSYGGGRGLTPTSALLLDTSSSMSSHIGANQTKISELRKLANGFTDVRRFHFGSAVEELKPSDAVPEPAGGTNLALAFTEVKKAGVTHVVLITDGQPDDARSALYEARGLRVDVFYVGPDPQPPFLADLARVTGGSYGKATLTALKELTAAVKQRLCIEAPKGAIQL